MVEALSARGRVCSLQPSAPTKILCQINPVGWMKNSITPWFYLGWNSLDENKGVGIWVFLLKLFLYEMVTAIDGVSVSINVWKTAWLMAILRKMTNYDSYTWLCGIGIDCHIRIHPNSIPILPDSGGRVTPNQHCCNSLLKAPPPTFDTFHS